MQEEWKDETNMDRIQEYLQKIADTTGAAIEAGDPNGDIAFLSEGINEYLDPYTKEFMQNTLAEDPDIDPALLFEKLQKAIGPLIKQFTLDKMNSILLRDGYYDPVNKVLQTRFPPDSDVEKAEFAYEKDDDGEHFGLKYTFKDGSFMFFNADMLERVNEKIMDGSLRQDGEHNSVP